MKRPAKKEQPGLKWYSVNGAVHGGKHLGHFQAASPEEAVEMGLSSEAASVSFCHHCSKQCENAEIADATAEEVDGPDES